MVFRSTGVARWGATKNRKSTIILSDWDRIVEGLDPYQAHEIEFVRLINPDARVVHLPAPRVVR